MNFRIRVGYDLGFALGIEASGTDMCPEGVCVVAVPPLRGWLRYGDVATVTARLYGVISQMTPQVVLQLGSPPPSVVP